MPRILIITGEASGDLHGANLAKALQKADPSLSIVGIGGALMKAAGPAGVSSAALTSMEQPAASAGPTLRTTWLIGKFHGVKAATGPTGSLTTIWRSSGLPREGTRRP